MSSWKEDFKFAAINLAYDYAIVLLTIFWVTAIVLALLEISLWIVFGLFFLGCVTFYAIRVIFEPEGQKKQPQPTIEPKEVEEEAVAGKKNT
ncbi:MAG: hypothetical protein U9O98_07225 [Asgard group archaeon]|nr:hypothetical protein [Asgard group archaeon]